MSEDHGRDNDRPGGSGDTGGDATGANPFDVLDPETRAALDEMGDFMSGYGLDHERIGWTEAAMLLADGDKRQVALTSISADGTSTGEGPGKDGEWCVSTVFMPWDMGHGRTKAPVLYESMALDGAGEIRKVERYATRDSALAGHDQVVAWVRAGAQPEPMPWADVIMGDGPMAPQPRGPEHDTDD